jgi:hypothetical protein
VLVGALAVEVDSAEKNEAEEVVAESFCGQWVSLK